MPTWYQPGAAAIPFQICVEGLPRTTCHRLRKRPAELRGLLVASGQKALRSTAHSPRPNVPGPTRASTSRSLLLDSCTALGDYSAIRHVGAVGWYSGTASSSQHSWTQSPSWRLTRLRGLAHTVRVCRWTRFQTGWNRSSTTVVLRRAARTGRLDRSSRSRWPCSSCIPTSLAFRELFPPAQTPRLTHLSATSRSHSRARCPFGGMCNWWSRWSPSGFQSVPGLALAYGSE